MYTQIWVHNIDFFIGLFSENAESSAFHFEWPKGSHSSTLFYFGSTLVFTRVFSLKTCMINFRVEKLFYVRSLFFVHFRIPLTVPISKFFAWTATKFFRGSHKVRILNVCVKWLNIERSKYLRGTLDRYSISRHRNAFGVLLCISCYCGNNIVYFQTKPSSPNMD